jgi:hypothetical protein
LAEEIYEKGGKEMLLVFIRQAKSIWMRRNAMVHRESFVDPNVLVCMTSQAPFDLKKENEQPLLSKLTFSYSVSWITRV